MRVRSWLVLAAVAVLVGGAATTYARSGNDPAGRYRLVTASVGTVEQTLSVNGTVDSAHRADVAFDISGTVSKVRVKQGQQVKAGAVIATLDRTSLRSDLEQATATLARARAQLETDENAQSAAVGSSVTSAPATGGGRTKSSQGPVPGGSSGGSTQHGAGGAAGSGSTHASTGGNDVQTKPVRDALKQLAAEQTAVTTAQSAASEALSDARTALATQGSACSEAFQPTPSGSPSGTTTPTPTPSGSPSGTTTPTPSGSTTEEDQACSDALAAVQTKQQVVDDAQRALTTDLATLTKTLDTALQLLGEAAGGTSGGASSPTPPARSTNHTKNSVARSAQSSTGTETAAYVVPTQAGIDTPSGSGSRSVSRNVTAATLATDQASIDTARGKVSTARQALAGSVLSAPLGGRVVSLDVAPGDSVAAGDDAAVVTSGHALLVTATVSETNIRSIRAGERVRVTTPGSPAVSTGTVSSIGLTVSSTSGTASYPVTIAVPAPTSALPVGSAVLLDIVLGSVRDAVTVPSSAVTALGTRSIVRVLKSGVLTTDQVTVGSVGARRTSITTGLKAGTQVVIADLDEQVTGASTSLNNRGGFGGAGSGGGFGSRTGGGARRGAEAPPA